MCVIAGQNKSQSVDEQSDSLHIFTEPQGLVDCKYMCICVWVNT